MIHMSRSIAPSRMSGGSSSRSMRAQASMEFMILFILFLVALGGALMVSINRSQTISQAQIDITATRILDDAADRINTAYIEGDGFSMNLTIPQKIIRKDYLINVSSNEVIIRLEGKTYVRTLLTNNVTGEFIKGKNRVMNYNGQIRITEAT